MGKSSAGDRRKSWRAPDTPFSWKKWGKRIGSRLLFPPILLWDITKLTINLLFGKLIDQRALPALYEDFEHDAKSLDKTIRRVNDFDGWYRFVCSENKADEFSNVSRAAGDVVTWRKDYSDLVDLWSKLLEIADAVFGADSWESKLYRKPGQIKVRDIPEFLEYLKKEVDGEGSKIAAPDQKDKIKQACGEALEAYNKIIEGEVVIERWNVITSDGAELDTVEVCSLKQDKLSSAEKKYIINFVGNGMSYEDIFVEMEADADALTSNVIGFNLRGVSRSTGRHWTTKDLVRDGITQVQRLLAGGANPENITLKGHSYGAGIATLVVADFHKRGIHIYLFNGRSFSNITNVAVGWVRKLSVILGYIVKPLVKFFLVASGREIEAADAYKTIPAKYKTHIAAKRAKPLGGDYVITHHGSLYADSGEKEKLNTAMRKILCSKKNLTPKALAAEKKRLKNTVKEWLKTWKMNSMDHNASLWLLRSRARAGGYKTGSAIFSEFFHREHTPFNPETILGDVSAGPSR